jgi:arylformamidase
MRRLTALLLAGLGPLLAAAQCEAQNAAQVTAPREMAYGADPRHRLDFWRSRSAGAPLIVFIHGGGWSSGDKSDEHDAPKVAYFHERGFAFSAVNYRLVPEVPVGEQVQDVANAIAYLVREGNGLGVDPNRVILMGHSSGGHLAALIGTDPTYLQRAGLDVSRIAGVVLLDGAGLVPRTGAAAARRRGPFNSDAERQAMAPITHTAAPNAARFLLLNAASEDLRQQAARLAESLTAAGTPAEVEIIHGADHMSLSADLGLDGDGGTAALGRFLDEMGPARD